MWPKKGVKAKDEYSPILSAKSTTNKSHTAYDKIDHPKTRRKPGARRERKKKKLLINFCF